MFLFFFHFSKYLPSKHTLVFFSLFNYCVWRRGKAKIKEDRKQNKREKSGKAQTEKTKTHFLMSYHPKCCWTLRITLISEGKLWLTSTNCWRECCVVLLQHRESEPWDAGLVTKSTGWSWRVNEGKSRVGLGWVKRRVRMRSSHTSCCSP